MFEVRYRDDAWDLGVLHTAGFITGTVDDLGVPSDLTWIFNEGRSAYTTLSEDRVDILACQRGVMAD